jgi:hypothetical protein
LISIASPRSRGQLVNLANIAAYVVARIVLVPACGQRRQSREPHPGSTAVLEYGSTETLPLPGSMLLGFARLCRPCRQEVLTTRVEVFIEDGKARMTGVMMAVDGAI